MGQGSPLAPGAVQVQNGIDHFTHLGGSGVSSWLGGRDQRFKDPPLVVAHIDFDSFFAASFHLFSPFFLCSSSSIVSPGRCPCRAAFQAHLSACPLSSGFSSLFTQPLRTSVQKIGMLCTIEQASLRNR